MIRFQHPLKIPRFIFVLLCLCRVIHGSNPKAIDPTRTLASSQHAVPITVTREPLWTSDSGSQRIRRSCCSHSYHSAAPDDTHDLQRRLDDNSPWPSCAATCSWTLYGFNVRGYVDCYWYGGASEHYRDCNCAYLSLCTKWCTGHAEKSTFSSFYKTDLRCSTFKSLTWGWMFGAVGHQVTNDPTFYDKYPSLSGTSVLPAATTALGYYKITGTQLDTSLLRPILATTTATSTSTRGAGVVEFFSAVKSGAPACVQNMPSVCPGLYSNASECYVRHAVPEPKDCFCVNVWDESCEGICTAREQPALYLRYIKGACSKRYSSSGTPKPPFADYQFYQSLAYKNLFPWTWNVTSQMAGSATVYPKSPNCPSRFAKLGSFAIINLVKLLSLAFLGRRTVVKYLTCKKCGRKGSPWWIFTPLLSTGLSVGITFYNASLVHHTRGYSSTPSAQLALLWLCRPRIAWLAIILGHIQLKKGMYVSLAASTALSEILEQGLTFVYMGRTAHFAHIRGYYLVYQINGVVIPKGRAALIMYSGAILWIVSIGFVILVTIWTFLGLGNLFKTLASRIFGQTKEAPEATRQVARNMGRTFSEYFSAWAANLRASIRQSVHLRVAERMQRNRVMDHLRLSQTLHRALNLVRITQRRIDMPSQQEELQQSSPVELSQEPPFPQHQTNRRALLVTESNWLKEMGLSPRALIKLRFILGWMVFPFIAQWLFWYGFVDLADDLYCPPHIWTLTILWCISALVTPVLQSAV